MSETLSSYPTYFFIYMNDFGNINVPKQTILYADDTSLIHRHEHFQDLVIIVNLQIY